MQNLAGKYRPSMWSEVVGQESIVRILNRQLETGNIKNTYIFSGASGCGKTTLARLFALEVNKYTDNAGNLCSSEPIEIDGASNNGVDNVKNIVAGASERSLDGKYKVFIIDEAHMLTTQAWNAFLKCIEEPPLYTIFIFCTTDPQKIPDTIKNRCMRFNFARIPSNLIYQRLLHVCENEGYSEYVETCDYISRICNGELRNALSLLETCADYGDCLSIENAVKTLGNFSYKTYFDLVNGIIDGEAGKVLALINEIYNSGADLKRFVNSFLDFNMDITKYILCKSISVTSIPSNLVDDLNFAIGIDNAQKYYFYITDKLLELKNMLKTDVDMKPTVEVMFSQMCRLI